MMEKPIKIIIKVSGGMVQDVYTDSNQEFDVEVWDQDALHDGNLDADQEGEETLKYERILAEIEYMYNIY
jgi:hypothetical protein